MKTGTKIWLIVGVLLIILGLGFFAAAMSANQWDFTRLSTAELETNTHRISETFHSISMETDTADIRFIPSEDGACRVVCTESEKTPHVVAVTDGVLTITVTDNREWYDYIGINIGDTKITVYLPAGEYASLNIRESTGDVEIPRDFSFSRMEINASTGDVDNAASASGEMKIKTSTGDIRVESVTAEMVDLFVSTGRITVASVTCQNEFKLHVSTGKIELTDVKCGTLSSTGNTGDISLRNAVASGKFSVERSTGDIRLDGCDAAEFSIKTSTGDVTGTLLSEKVFSVKTDTGRVNVPGSANGGMCNIITSTGDVRIEIE